MASQKSRLRLSIDEVINECYKVEELLGEGAAGVVYRVNQISLNIPRAMKILDPIGENVEAFDRTFEQEIEHLSLLTHKNIIKIIDRGTFLREDRPYVYFVSEYIKEGLLESAFNSINTRSELLSLLAQLFEVVAYIHDFGLMHADIKPSNILYDRNPTTKQPEVKLADLGVSKIFYDQPYSLVDTTSTEVYGTRIYAHPEIRRYLNSGESIPKSLLSSENGKIIDLYALGVTIASLLSSKELKDPADSDTVGILLNNLKPNLAQLIEKEELQYLRRFLKRLTSVGYRNERKENSLHLAYIEEEYRTAQDAHSSLMRLTPEGVKLSQMPELTGVGCKYRLTHGGGGSRISSRMLKWINHPTFQRLHNLNQLGFLFLIYPDARHSRFSHSLRVFEIARIVVLNLLNDSTFRYLFSEKDINHFLCASLLHDIGHYPLAHLLEELRTSRPPKDPRDLSSIRSDYELIEYFLLEEVTGYDRLWDVISSDGFEPSVVVGLASKVANLPSNLQVLQTLIDGTFDIDKIAYLSHDSHASSVDYGKGVDFAGLISSLTILHPIDYPEIRQPQIGISRSGISALESVVTARYHMYDRVYWHRTNRAIMAMLNYSVSRLIWNNIISFEQYLQTVKNKTDWEAINWLSVEFDQAISKGLLGTLKDREIQNPLPGITNGTRSLYKRLITFSRNPQKPMLGDIHEGMQHQEKRDLDELRNEIIELIQHALKMPLGDHEVLLDIPRKRPQNEARSDSFWILDENTQSVHPLVNYSAITKATFDQYQSIANCSRLFVSPRIATRCREDSYLIEEIIALMYANTRLV